MTPSPSMLEKARAIFRDAEKSHRSDEELIALALEAVQRERDYEWWEAVVLNDAVAPEPQAAKKYVASLTDLAQRERTLECARLVCWKCREGRPLVGERHRADKWNESTYCHANSLFRAFPLVPAPVAEKEEE